MAFAQASLGPLGGDLEGLGPTFQGAFGQSSQTIEVLLGQSEGVLGAGGNPAAEAQTQGALSPEQQEALVQIAQGIAHANAWDRTVLEQLQGIVGKLEGRSSPGIGDYWFFVALDDQLSALMQRLSALASALGVEVGEVSTCELSPASRFLCDEAAWKDFRRSFTLENYGTPALNDPKVNNDYAWELAYLSGVVLRQALGDMRRVEGSLSSASPLLPLLTENLSVLNSTDAFVSGRLKGYPYIPANKVIERADTLSGDQGGGDGA
jgi:hypothetical protein